MTVYHTLGAIPSPAGGSSVALGLFDGLHLGHRSVINRTVEQADNLGLVPCVFTFDLDGARPGAKQGGRLVSGRTTRSLLERWRVEKVFLPPFSSFREMEPRVFVEKVLLASFGARTVCCGENFRFGRGGAASAQDLRELGRQTGIQVLVTPLIEVGGSPVSATRIRRLIQEGEIPGANALLGRRFSIDFEVVHGRQLGRTIGSPTINQPFPEEFVIPRFGVYATVTRLDGKRYVSVTNVGVKPTVGSDAVLAETYIHGFAGDLYGREVQVEFLQFIRPEQKFATVEELKARIQKDSRTAVELAGQYSL